MIRISIRGLRNIQNFDRKFEEGVRTAQAVVAEVALGDISQYVPRDKDPLMNSAYYASNFAQGELVWNTPYAAYQYYGVHLKHSKDRNPLAQAMWDRKAETVHAQDWARLAKSEVLRKLLG